MFLYARNIKIQNGIFKIFIFFFRYKMFRKYTDAFLLLFKKVDISQNNKMSKHQIIICFINCVSLKINVLDFEFSFIRSISSFFYRVSTANKYFEACIKSAKSIQKIHEYFILYRAICPFKKDV